MITEYAIRSGLIFLSLGIVGTGIWFWLKNRKP